MNFTNPYVLNMPFPPQANILPSQQVIQANGKASIDALRMQPNSSVLVMDSTAPMVWLCVSDGLGNVNSTAYDITPHKETAKDESGLEARISALEERMNELVKSNDASAKSKPSVRAGAKDSAD